MSLTASKRSFGSRLLLVAVAALAASACSKKDDPIVVVPPPPAPVATIVLNPSTVNFSDTVATTSPDPVSVAVTNSGTLALTGLTLGTITYGGSAGSGWLIASISGVDAPATVTLTASNVGLAAGTYSATVPVIAVGATNTPQNVQVTYQVAGAVGPPPPPVVTGPTLLAAGNISQCGLSGPSNATALVVESQLPATVIAMGDMQFPSDTTTGAAATASDFANCYNTTWGRFKNLTWPVVGNREQDSLGFSAGADAYFGAGLIGQPGRNWYSFDLGTWHVIVLNVSSGGAVTYGNNSNQLDFVIADLAANAGKKCVMAIWHDPYQMSSSLPGFITHSTQSGIWRELYNAGADVVLNGGQHQYERMAPMDNQGAVDSLRGILQINNGLGGDGWQDPTVIHPNSVVRGVGRGVLKMVLGDGNYSWEFLAAAGTTFTDSGTGTCH